ncbi:MAG: serine/threonine-protein kinase, partial [Gemmatimonadota bacterium]
MTDLLDRLRSYLSERYRIEDEVAEGGMAIVFRATDLKHERTVAVKVLKPELSAMVGADRFLREIRITAQLQHPHILPLYDSGAAGELLYYVMPFINGESLRGRLTRERALPVSEAVALVTAVASALDYAHRQGVLHRDIKPENILLHDQQPLLADFGIALAVSVAGGERLTVTGLSVGTPSYMSPEQIAGEQVLDARTDIYALGCVAYELLAGEPPFTGQNLQAVMASVMTSAPRPLSESRHT